MPSSPPPGDHPDTKTEAIPGLAPAAGARATYVLTVVEGEDEGKVFTVAATRPSPLLIGTSATCDGRLRDASVSRRHLALEVMGLRLRIEDLGSANGTFVDGLSIREAYARGGEMIRVGRTAIRVDEGPESPRSSELPRRIAFGPVVGASSSMQRLYPLCERLAATTVPVVIEGETGTGKENLAESIHREGPRGAGPFVVFDCTAVASSLIESELFGHERGAFTGATSQRKGVFERAHGGTLLIDEIGDMPLELQPKLLRAIERSEITRVGGAQPIRVDVRILAATRRDLDREVQEGRFRDDLFHRLAVARIELPPLRRRTGDISLLARNFCLKSGVPPEALSAALLKRWETYAWPGNVRELRNAVARFIAVGDLVTETLGTHDAEPIDGGDRAATSGDAIGQIIALDLPHAEARDRVLSEFETRYVERLLELHGGNVTRAAAAAGIARRHLQRLKSRRDPSE